MNLVGIQEAQSVITFSYNACLFGRQDKRSFFALYNPEEKGTRPLFSPVRYDGDIRSTEIRLDEDWTGQQHTLKQEKQKLESLRRDLEKAADYLKRIPGTF